MLPQRPKKTPTTSLFIGGPLDGQHIVTDGRYMYRVPVVTRPLTFAVSDKVDPFPSMEIGEYTRDRHGSYWYSAPKPTRWQLELWPGWTQP